MGCRQDNVATSKGVFLLIFLLLSPVVTKDSIQRRLSFLYYILHEDPKSLMCRIFRTQLKNRTKHDWEELKLTVNFVEIKRMKKVSFVDKSVKELNKTKESHSKVMGLKHEYLKKLNRYFL